MAQALEGLYRCDSDVLPYTPGSAVTAGEILQLSDKRAAVADRDIGASVLGSIRVRGLVDVKKATTGVPFGDGDPVYWDYSGNTALLAPAAIEDFLLGPAVGAAAEAADHVLVNLNDASGRTFIRRITDADMSGVPGFEGEAVYNDADNKVYKCTVSSATSATWVELDEP